MYKTKTKIHTGCIFQANMIPSPNKLGDEMIIELAEISVEEDFEIRQKHTKDSYFKMKLAWLDREVTTYHSARASFLTHQSSSTFEIYSRKCAALVQQSVMETCALL